MMEWQFDFQANKLIFMNISKGATTTEAFNGSSKPQLFWKCTRHLLLKGHVRHCAYFLVLGSAQAVPIRQPHLSYCHRNVPIKHSEGIMYTLVWPGMIKEILNARSTYFWIISAHSKNQVFQGFYF